MKKKNFIEEWNSYQYYTYIRSSSLEEVYMKPFKTIIMSMPVVSLKNSYITPYS